VLLVTLFLALTALQFVVSTNLPNSRCAVRPPAPNMFAPPALGLLCPCAAPGQQAGTPAQL
jgi:hypothetical protein